MLDLEKELNKGNINERTLTEKHGFSAEKIENTVIIESRPEIVKFGSEEFYALFYITKRRTHIKLIPVKFQEEASRAEGELKRYKVCLKAAKSLHGRGYKFKDDDLQGTRWRTSGYDIACCMHTQIEEGEPDDRAGGAIWITLRPMRRAMKGFFDRQQQLWYDEFGTKPTIPFKTGDQCLLVSGPNSEMEAEWEPVFADSKRIRVKGLCGTLSDFYNSYYYRQLRGYLGDIKCYFPQIRNRRDAKTEAKAALEKGKDIFPDRNLAAIALCEVDGKDGLILFYDQDNDSMFVWDIDKNKSYFIGCTLIELFEMMEPCI